MTSLSGKLLIASPHLDDANFYRAVILMIHHGVEESFGVILNRPTDQSLNSVMAMVTEAKCVHESQIYSGGPVEGPLIAIHVAKQALDISKGLSIIGPSKTSIIDPNPSEKAFEITGELGLKGDEEPDFHELYRVTISVLQDDVLRAIQDETRVIRVFEGYAGWGPGQLEREIASGSWLLGNALAHFIFGDSTHLWEQVVHAIGAEILSGDLQIESQLATDPSLN